MTSPDREAPATEAGRALMGAAQELQRVGQVFMADTVRQMILAIEVEASVPTPHKSWCATYRYNLGLACNCDPAAPPTAEARTIATMRLREALDMERATSGGNAMTPLQVAGFIGGPWLDYIAEPYAAAPAAPQPDEALRAALERMQRVMDNDEGAAEVFDAVRAVLAALTAKEEG